MKALFSLKAVNFVLKFVKMKIKYFASTRFYMVRPSETQARPIIAEILTASEPAEFATLISNKKQTEFNISSNPNKDCKKVDTYLDMST